MGSAKSRISHDADYWWLVLRFAMRDGRIEDVANAIRQLADLGIEVRLRRIEAVTQPEGVANG